MSSKSTTSTPKKIPKLMRATYLGPAEEFLWEGRPSGYLYFPGPILFLALVMIYNIFLWGSYVKKYMSNSFLDSILKIIPAPPSILSPVLTATSTHSPDLIAGTLLLLIAVIYLGIKWFKRATTVYALTNTRLIRQKGILSTNFDEIQVRQIRGIDVKQTALQRLFGYGTVSLSAESGTQSSLGNEVWVGFPKPPKFQELVEGAQERLAQIVPAQQPIQQQQPKAKT